MKKLYTLSTDCSKVILKLSPSQKEFFDWLYDGGYLTSDVYPLMPFDDSDIIEFKANDEENIIEIKNN